MAQDKPEDEGFRALALHENSMSAPGWCCIARTCTCGRRLNELFPREGRPLQRL